ncbi:hypothetical protein WICPIJ_009583 [Wickerhamomyces pijperi]|uniref:Uncharacterized protein n=1 Tax=Wickerhamomyces pijperi TaxID=599730 RepID=A0A9P8PMU4_WICPI|nr:hypothetical protein WICPIJ_009583 [Wickerhamomyces pijperi]
MDFIYSDIPIIKDSNVNNQVQKTVNEDLGFTMAFDLWDFEVVISEPSNRELDEDVNITVDYWSIDITVFKLKSQVIDGDVMDQLRGFKVWIVIQIEVEIA